MSPLGSLNRFDSAWGEGEAGHFSTFGHKNPFGKIAVFWLFSSKLSKCFFTHAYALAKTVSLARTRP